MTTEIRLYIVALLGAVYAITWRAIDGHASSAPAERAVRAAPERVVWIDALPPAQQPRVALPDGWQRVGERAPPSPRLVRVPTKRAPRIRTRSS